MELNCQKLRNLYIKNRKSVSEIASRLGCSQGKINYWLYRYKIKKRDISEAIYIKHNPKGDPFSFRRPKNIEDAILFGLGIGLYWGEGTKANKTTVRLGNSDPILLKTFIRFLIKFFRIKKEDLKFHLHIFTDIDTEKATKFWVDELDIKKEQFYKPTITQTGKLGTYRKKSEYGVLTVYYGNIKLKKVLMNLLPM